MKLQLIRNATMRITYGGVTLLTDPMLSAVGGIESFAGVAPNPTIKLPLPMEKILSGIDAVLVSHVHQDHFDQTAFDALSKTIPLYCQPCDETRFRVAGFQQAYPVEKSIGKRCHHHG
jgi:L-ascorbate metabolism protein UlaG (beta-lactamase superfamily)